MTHVKLGSLLRQHRLDAHLTQAELAAHLDYHRSHVARVERNERPPTADYLRRLIETLALPPADQEALWALFQAEGDTAAGATLALAEPRRDDWNLAPDTSAFYGREDELATLAQWLVAGRCRLVAILGMRGIGKTMAATKLARQVAAEFDVVIWRSLLNAPPLVDLVGEWIQILSEQREMVLAHPLRDRLPRDENRRLALLVEHLRRRRCLLVLDNLETVLQDAGQTETARPESGEYHRLLHQIGQTAHRSCLLLTSRIRPDEITALAGERGPVRFLYLGGLPPADARRVLAEKALAGDDTDWTALIERYAGNPHFLKIVAARIQDLYGGDIALFLRSERGVSSLHVLLDREFARLSSRERTILHWLAVAREPASLVELHRLIVPSLPEWQLADALTTLVGRRSLAERRGPATFTLHPVMMEYVTAKLVEGMYEELIRVSTGASGESASDAGDPLTLFTRHALILAQAPTYVRESQSRLILGPVAQRLVAQFGQRRVHQPLRQTLSALKTHYAQKPGYGGGNLLDLLRHLQIEPDGWDFSGLSIWQADLAGMRLRAVNLTGADLTGSVFTTTFGIIASLAASPAGMLLAAGTAGGEVRLWRLPDCVPLVTWQGHTAWILTLAFDGQSRWLASGSEDCAIKVWDVHSGECLHTLQGHTDRVRAVVFSRTGDILFSGDDDGVIKAWDMESGARMRTWQAHDHRIRVLALHADGATLASGGDDHVVKLWDARRFAHRQTLKRHTNFVLGLAFHPGKQQLASGSEDHTVRLWDMPNQQSVQVFAGRHLVNKVVFHPAGHLLAGSADRHIHLWDAGTGRLVRSFSEHTNRIRDISFVAGGQTLASGGEDQTIRLWDVETGKCIQVLQGYSGWIRHLACSPDGKTVASSSYGSAVLLWDLQNGHVVRSFQAGNDAEAVAFDPDGRTLAGGDDDGFIHLWDAHTGTCRQVLQGHTDRVRCVVFHPNGLLLASSSADLTVRLWDLQTGQCLHTLRGHHHHVMSCAFDRRGTLLASSSYDQTIRLWDPATGECLQVLHGHTDWIRAIAIHPTGNLLASASDDHTVKLWDLNTGGCVRTLDGHTHRVRSVGFRPDGQLLASASEDQTIQLWDVATAQHVKTLRGHTNRVADVVFHPDGHRLISGGDDETIRIWDIHTGRCIQTFRNRQPYEGTDITDATGLTEAQRTSLRALGAIG